METKIVEFIATNSFKKHRKGDDKFFTISQGGRGSGKTFSILLLIILRLIRNPYQNIIVSVVAETMPVLKRGAIRDFKMILNNAGLWEDKKWNKTENIYTFFGNMIEFFSVDDDSRARGPARDILYINESNNVRYETAFQLISRTRQKVYLDFNPVSEFYAHIDIMQNEDFADKFHFLKTTYLDNEELDQTIIENILARANKDENYKRVYIDGEIGNLEGLIFNNFYEIDKIPQEVIDNSKIQWFGLDWGYSNDPTSLLNIFILGDSKKPVQEIYIDELFYDTAQSLRPSSPNKVLSNIIKEHIIKSPYRVICDTSDPNSRDDIKSYGINIESVSKTIINFGIELLKDTEIYITKNSTNTIKEFRNYTWAKDRNGVVKRDNNNNPVPVDLWNHSIDNIRYVATTAHNQKFQSKTIKRQSLYGGLVKF